jgi:hypothetical protein
MGVPPVGGVPDGMGVGRRTPGVGARVLLVPWAEAVERIESKRMDFMVLQIVVVGAVMIDLNGVCVCEKMNDVL